MITARQCRAARALLGWSQGELADRSGVAQATIANIETEKRTTYVNRIYELETALGEAGVEFGDLARSAVSLRSDYISASAPRARQRLSPLRVVRGTKKVARLESRYDDKKVIVQVDNKSIDDYFCVKFTNHFRLSMIEANLLYIADIVENKINKGHFMVSDGAAKRVINIDIGKPELKNYALIGLDEGQVPYAGLPEDKYAEVISFSASPEKSVKSATDKNEVEE